VNSSLRRLWLRLTAWYVGVFAAVLLVLGGGLFWAVTVEIKRALDRDLAAAVDQAARALEIRERERGIQEETLVDALDELHVPGHDIYVFDGTGAPLRPHQAPAWVSSAAAEAMAKSPVTGTVRTGDQSWRLYARSVQVAESHFSAVAVAETFEIGQQYPTLLTAFLAAGFAALVLVAIGGSLLARNSMAPVQSSIERMRRFVADASHELRTPTAVLRSTAEVGLQRERSAEEYGRLLETIRDEAQDLGNLVDGLLLLASADEGRLPLRRDRLFLDDVLVDALGRARVLAAPKEVAIRLGHFEEAPVTGDPVLLRQLIMIVLHNAVKFTPSGGWVEGSATRSDDRCRVTVRDSGPGIPASDLPHVFDRFYRVDPSRSADGAGLGLSIARAIADAHRAEIRIESAAGGGTVVTIDLPAAPSAARASV
jgi:signal transduction histidine kinase